MSAKDGASQFLADCFIHLPGLKGRDNKDGMGIGG
jgi:hypothetical protein